MDWQRTLLIAALAVVSYLMILQWQKDYIQPTTAQTENHPQSYPQADQIPDQSAQQVSAADVPQAPTSTADAALAEKSPVQMPTSNIITVDTDTLRVTIDPRGGDIIRVGLKEYPVALDQPEVPFDLLRSGNGMTYIAQSGLTGTNGPDSAKSGRPLYASTKTHYSLDGDTLSVDLTFHQDSGRSRS